MYSERKESRAATSGKLKRKARKRQKDDPPP
jgi:hypothetical protein